MPLEGSIVLSVGLGLLFGFCLRIGLSLGLGLGLGLLFGFCLRIGLRLGLGLGLGLRLLLQFWFCLPNLPNRVETMLRAAVHCPICQTMSSFEYRRAHHLLPASNCRLKALHQIASCT